MPVDSRIDSISRADQLLDQLEGVEAQLRQMQDAVNRNQKLVMLGTMSAILAHEFNNLLTPVISYCQMAQQSPDDQVLVAKAVDRSLRAAQRAAQISSSMLGFVRHHDESPSANLEQVMTEVLNCLVRPPQRDGIELTVTAKECVVPMAPTALHQVMLNLVINSLMSMTTSKSPGRLQICGQGSGAGTRVDVIDTGPGIPADLLPRIFEPFVTSRAGARDTESKGTGLGLTVCRDLVQRAGGTIRVAHTGPEGTTIRLQWPDARN